ncbi:YhjD/YihY/BrkB family envelope integrity protein [uncultured Roseobacter sp.]|uniref:YhjD/YihY/BrkB family envelope integrity protein n=1 Tax=uncultured Roseobacter sp. TaxID=114847 RepID=UPI00345CA470
MTGRDAPEWKWASVGAIMGCLVWIVASAGFAFYVSNFGSYNESFGTLAGVIVLLMLSVRTRSQRRRR